MATSVDNNIGVWKNDSPSKKFESPVEPKKVIDGMLS